MVQTSGVLYDFFSVHFESEISGWAVGWDLVNLRGAIRYTSNGGNSWVSQLSYSMNNLYSVFFISESCGWAVGWAGTILHTLDGGNNWDFQQTDSSNALLSVYFTSELEGWCAGYKMYDVKGILLHTTNRGETWVQSELNTSQLISIFFINSMCGWATGSNGTIIHTTNGGNNWSYQTSGVNNGLCSVYFTSSTNGWIVGYHGLILYTTDGGDHWIPQISGVIENLNSVNFPSSTTGYAVGNSGIILKTTNGGITFVQENLKVSNSNVFLLSQNYPNPFNPTTYIEYQTPNSELILLKILDVLGDEVATLVNEVLPAGRYIVKFDGSNLASGIYFYQLKAGNFTSTKKIILLK